MGVLMVEKYVVKPEKQAEFMVLIKRFLEYQKENPDKFKEVKSWKLFTQKSGGMTGAYIEMWRFDCTEDMNVVLARLSKDEEFMKMFPFMPLIEASTFSRNLWNSVLESETISH